MRSVLKMVASVNEVCSGSIQWPHCQIQNRADLLSNLGTHSNCDCIHFQPSHPTFERESNFVDLSASEDEGYNGHDSFVDDWLDTCSDIESSEATESNCNPAWSKPKKTSTPSGSHTDNIRSGTSRSTTT